LPESLDEFPMFHHTMIPVPWLPLPLLRLVALVILHGAIESGDALLVR